jgi:acyl-CoA reductase-like NAD-dependent aldehyde dehydrogenase
MTQRTISPVNGSVYVERELAAGSAIEAALDRAVVAQRAWRHSPLTERIVCALLERRRSARL